MNCPVCDKPMIVFELDEVEVDHCVRCRGTWLDAGELELLLDGADNRDELFASLSTPVESDEKPRPCPICEKKMHKVEYRCEGAEAVTLDKCKKNDGLWFDHGELSGILDKREFPCQGKVYNLLSDLFGHKKSGDA